MARNARSLINVLKNYLIIAFRISPLERQELTLMIGRSMNIFIFLQSFIYIPDARTIETRGNKDK